MQSSDTPFYDLVLIGGGHANIQVLKNFAMKPVRGLRVTLISDTAYAPYSGMLPGHLAGWYSFDQAHFDLRSICEQAGVRFLLDPVIGINSERKEIFFRERPKLKYDFAAINVGIAPKPVHFLAGKPPSNFLLLKPISELLSQWRNFLKALDHWPSSQPLRLAVLGGGAAGVEISSILVQLLKNHHPHHKLTLISRHSTLLRGHAHSAQLKAKRALENNGVEVLLDEEAHSFDGKTLALTHQNRDFDFVFCATEAQAPEWLKNTDLPLDNEGFIQTDKCLRVRSRANLFAAGDCIDFASQGLPKAGVYAVRQGPYLAENLRRSFFSRPLKEYKPQKNALALLVVGEKDVLLSRGPFSLQSQKLWRWKDAIDIKFMQRFQKMPDMTGVKFTASLSREGYTENPCGGCGSKVSPDLLENTLSALRSEQRFLLSEDLGRDDASLHSPPTSRWIVQNLDAFRSFLSDPYIFGQIAAEHALNDIYAMGAKPTSAQVLLTLQKMHPLLAERDFSALMYGVVDRLTRSGTALCGGHTVEGDELSIGLSILGEVETPIPKKVSREASLILLKPLGTGALFKANMVGAARGSWIDAALESMLLSQQSTVDILKKHEVSALTDVTGFGLLGHLVEMIHDTGFTAELDSQSIPMLDGFEDCIPQHSTLLSVSNSDFCRSLVNGEISPLLADPQTSGGLLAAVPSELTTPCLQNLREAGFSRASLIGKISHAQRKETLVAICALS